MTSSNRFSVLPLLILLSLIFSADNVLAKSNASMDVKKAKYIKVTKPGYGPTYPTPGPVIEVYAEGSSAEYTHIANTHKPLKIHLGYTASCSNRGKLTGVTIKVGETSQSMGGGGGFKSNEPWIELPFSEFSAIKAKKLCNEQAKTLSLEKNLPLEKIVQKGFAMKLSNVVQASGTAYCKAAGLGKGGVKSDNAKLDAWVVCKPNPKARKPRASKSTKTTKHTPDPGKATTNFKSASFKANKNKFSSKCPTSIVYTGNIQASGKGSIEYQWIGNSNYKSPVKTVKFNSAGKKEFKWTRSIKKPEKSKSRAVSAANTDPNKLKGWMALKVTYRIKNKMASAKKVWTSKKQDFEVNCTVPSKTLKLN